MFEGTAQGANIYEGMAKGTDLQSVFILILVLILVLVVAYYATKFFSKMARHGGRGGGMHMLDQLYLGRDKHVLLIKVGEKGYLLSLTGQNSTLIDTLDKEELISLEEMGQKNREGREETAKENLRKTGDFLRRLTRVPRTIYLAFSQKSKQRQKPSFKEEIEAQKDDLDQLITAVQNKKDYFGIKTGGGEEP